MLRTTILPVYTETIFTNANPAILGKIHYAIFELIVVEMHKQLIFHFVSLQLKAAIH